MREGISGTAWEKGAPISEQSAPLASPCGSPRPKTPDRIGVSLVGELTLASRLHEVFSAEKFRLRGYLAEKSSLRHSILLDEVVTIGSGKRLKPGEILDAVNSGTLVPDDWVIFGDDTVLRLLTQGGASEHVLTELLPAKSPDGRQILGSKVGLATICERHHIPQPPGRAFHSQDALVDYLSLRTAPAVIKGDSGGAGQAVFIWTPENLQWQEFVDVSWYPVLVQDFVDGPLISVEALFRQGQLVGALYSDAVGFISPLSQSSIRHFRRARSHDYLETLQAIARIGGLHGFANTSFVWDETNQRHLLFELDMRPNFWHQFGPRLGTNWAELMTRDFDSPTKGLSVPHTVSAEAVVHLFPRELDFALRQRRLGPIIPWLRRDSGTWQWRQRRDRAVNRLERRSIMRALAQVMGLGRLLPHNPPAILTPGGS